MGSEKCFDAKDFFTSERNVQGTDIQKTDITCETNVKGTYNTSERNVQGLDITC